MATKAAKKASGAFALAVSSAVNWIPLCVQVEHAGKSSGSLKLSIKGKRLPNSVYFLLQNPNQAGNGHVTLHNGKGLFIHPGPGDPVLELDSNGMTPILVLNPLVKKPKAPVIWEHTSGGRLMSGGGMIIDG